MQGEKTEILWPCFVIVIQKSLMEDPRQNLLSDNAGFLFRLHFIRMLALV